MQEIPRFATLESFLQHCTSSQTPALYCLTADEQSPAHVKWTRDFLAAQTLPVNVHRSSSGNLFDLAQGPIELATSGVTHRTTLGALVQSFTAANRQGFDLISGTDTHLLLEGRRVPPGRDALFADVAAMVDLLVPRNELRRVGFWVSPCGVATQMHWDVNGHHNFNFQLHGDKEVVMFAPDDARFTYQMPARLFHLSRVDPRPGRFSLDAFPLFARAKPMHASLRPGDVLFIPCRWLHHFSHIGQLNVNVTAWFVSPRSGETWTWADVLDVARPLQALAIVVKLVFALAVLAPLHLLTSREPVELRATY